MKSVGEAEQLYQQTIICTCSAAICEIIRGGSQTEDWKLLIFQVQLQNRSTSAKISRNFHGWDSNIFAWCEVQLTYDLCHASAFHANAWAKVNFFFDFFFFSSQSQSSESPPAACDIFKWVTTRMTWGHSFAEVDINQRKLKFETLVSLQYGSKIWKENSIIIW